MTEIFWTLLLGFEVAVAAREVPTEPGALDSEEAVDD